MVSRKTLILVGLGVGVIIIIVAVLIAMQMRKRRVSAIKEEPEKDLEKKVGLWMRPGVAHPYDTGLDFYESEDYCKEHGGKYATKQQLLDAQEKGFERCVAGWHMAGGHPAVGYVMNSVKSGCGAVGYNRWNANKGDKRGTYCYGEIPDDVRTDYIEM